MRSHEWNPAEPPIEPLTRREREILSLLAQGHSAPEIAAQLILAVSSVKWHIQQVYGKLGVNRKRQALERAGELGLLAGPTSPASQPPKPAPRHNLPLQVSRFFGRETEIAQLKGHVAEHRLVTLTGPGGVGKTRLALRVGEDVLADFQDGVWFVELASLSDSALVAQAVAAVLGVRDEPSRPMLEALTAYLDERQVLLLLDNCEHLLDACARLAEALLRACTRIKILATSREALAIGGEAVYPVASLPFPDPGRLPALESLLDYDAMKLLVDRAQAHRPDYQLAEHNAADLARICQRLDGIPLAIEMAAARLTLMSARQVADRLDDAFGVLTGGSRTALPRQQTLRATIDWSYHLLGDAERLLFQLLSVFAGGCSLEAVEAIGSKHGLDITSVVGLLGSLVDKSLVIADHPPGAAPRYRLLEIMRQFAAEKLAITGEVASLRRHHAYYFLTFAETIAPKLGSRDRLVYTRSFVAERDNLRLALDWFFTNPAHSAAGVRLILSAFPEDMASTLWTYGEIMDWQRKGLEWCRSHDSFPPELHAALLAAASSCTSLNDPYAALPLAQQAVELSRRLGPDGKAVLMESLCLLGWRYLVDLDDCQNALAPYAESEAILNELGPAKLTPEEFSRERAWVSYIKGILAEKQGQFQAAQNHALESVRLYEASGDHWAATRPRHLLGSVCLKLGECDAARTHLLEALRLNEESGSRYRGHILCLLGFVELATGNLSRAFAHAAASVRQSTAAADHNMLASSLGLMASIWAKWRQAERAARLAGASHALYARQKRSPWEDTALDTLLPGWRETPEQMVIQQAYEAGQAMSTHDAIVFALA